MNRIAPNNQFPATHFVEVWKGKYRTHTKRPKPIWYFNSKVKATLEIGGKTIAIFRIRENKLPTKHKF